MTTIFRTSILALISIQCSIGVAQQRPVMGQFSVLPGLSTNVDTAKTTTNHFSFNLFGGDNGGVQGFELSPFVNILNERLEGMQVAGITNIVHGPSRALQVAGIINFNHNTFEGMQLAGIANSNLHNFIGLQAAGIYNQAKNVMGGQISAISSLADTLYGLQATGFSNVTNKTIGLQVSAISNTSQHIVGSQISGLLNVAYKLEGLQLGLINISDTVLAGVPIGFISFSKHGYQSIDLQYNELFPATLSFKTGVDAFYNIFTTSSNFNEVNHLWTFGYGVGSRMHLTPNSLIEFEATVSYLSQNDFDKDDVNVIGRFQSNIAVQLGKWMEIYLGPSLSVYATQMYNADTDSYGYYLGQNIVYSNTFYDLNKPTHVQFWIGGQVGFRF